MIPLIIGAVRMAADHPTLAAFTFPARPDLAPTIPGGTSQHETRRLLDLNNLARRDFAVITGFCRGASELIRNNLDSEYYEDLEHVRYGYDRIKPREYIEHLEAEHCPLDERATKSAREYYFRGWERTRSPRPEGLKKFGKRLDEEQEALGLDGITISDADKKEHYLMQIYTSGVFPATTVREWKKKPSADQTYANTKTFFHTEQIGLSEVHRLTGDTTKGNGYESAQAALERGLDTILERFNDRVETRIQEAVEDGIAQLTAARQPTEQINAATESSINQLRDQMADLTTALKTLQRDVSSLAAANKRGGSRARASKEGEDAKGGAGDKGGGKAVSGGLQ